MKSFEAVLKVGGSLGRCLDLDVLCKEISQLGVAHKLFVVPGGGVFADVVRDYYRRFQLSETTAHRMAILAMDQYGCFLGDLIPHSILVSDIESAHLAASNGFIPILLPSNLIIQVDPLPHSWQVTSDSIAAWIAGQSNASRLILLKAIDGILRTASVDGNQTELVSDLDVRELDRYPGNVDEYLLNILTSVKLETWVINGLYPSRLVELITTGQTIGTRVRKNGLSDPVGNSLVGTEH